MKLQLTITVSAIKVEKKTHIVHDGGAFNVEAGDWLVFGGAYGPTTMTQAEMADSSVVVLNEAEDEVDTEYLRWLLE